MIALLNKKIFLLSLFTGLFICFLLLSILTEQYFWIGIPFAILVFYAGWQQINSLFLLLLFALPFSFEYHFSSELGTDIPDEFLMLMVAALFFLYFFYLPKNLNTTIRRHPLMILLFIYLGWIFLTIFFSTDKIISLKFFLAKLWYIGAFVLAPLIVFQQKESIKSAAKILGISMFVVVIISLLRHAGYGFSFANINDSLFPFFRNHVNYSAMLVCIIPLFFAFHKLAASEKMKLLIKSAVIILLVALFFSYSRGAWLALLVGLVSYWLIRKKKLFIFFVSAVVITLSLLFWIKSNDRYLKFANDYKTTIFHKDFREHLIATYELKDVSTAERFYRWIAGVRMIKDNLLHGYGPNTFYYNYKPYAVPAFRTWVSNNEDHSTVHNYFLLITVEQGIPGLIFFLLLLGSMIYYSQKLFHRSQDIFYKTTAITTGVILMMITVVNFLSDLIETDKIGSIFLLCFAVLIVTDINSGKESEFSPNIQSIS